jgi:hypothetical protein
MGFQALGQSECGCSCIEHDGIAVFNVAVSGGSNCALFSAVLLSALEKRSVEATAMGEYRTAECALQKVLALQVVQILANRNHTDRKAVRQLTDIQSASFF